MQIFDRVVKSKAIMKISDKDHFRVSLVDGKRLTIVVTAQAKETDKDLKAGEFKDFVINFTHNETNIIRTVVGVGHR